MLLANAAGEIDGVGAFNGFGNLIALGRGKLGGGASVSLDFTHGGLFVIGGTLDASGGISIGWQQVADMGVRLPPRGRSAKLSHFGRSARLPIKQRESAA